MGKRGPSRTRHGPHVRLSADTQRRRGNTSNRLSFPSQAEEVSSLKKLFVIGSKLVQKNVPCQTGTHAWELVWIDPRTEQAT
ncbi:hypothetical protein VD0002_g1526 [Verticillium dahliae]|nr:hypothetical protein VD0002_g1526 [Verticillium dahliae]